MSKKFSEEALNRLDVDLRAGKLETVKQALEKMESQKFPRPLLVKIANLARRAGHQRYAVRLLRSIVRAEKPIIPEASAEEKIEYAVSLLRLGGVAESFNILAELDGNKHPEILLYEAFCHFNTWNHGKAIPLLEKYVSSGSVTGYQLLVGKSNLALAYTVEMQFEKGKKVIEDILASADKKSQKLLVGFAHQLYSELLIGQRNEKQALVHLKAAEELLKDANYRYSLHNNQLSAVIKLLSPKTSEKGIAELKKVREIAAQKKLWEFLRDCDLYEAALTKNKEILTKLYFGTPFENYRKRLFQMYGEEVTFDADFIYCPLGKPQHENFCLDVNAGVDLKSGSKIGIGQLLHKLLVVLSGDFYRPFKLQTLFSILFPDEYYNASSPHKIYDLIRRLDAWFKTNGIPIKVISHREEYRLKLTNPYGLKIKPFVNVEGPMDKFVDHIKSAFKDEWFSCADVVKLTGFSRSKAKRFLREGIELNKIESSGQSKTTRYLIK
jgi:tetratricopeptide (TPR) repeat protein